MKLATSLAAAFVLLSLSTVSQANVFNLGQGLTNLETVVVGDPGNAPDVHWGSAGAVGYTYGMGKFEVTAAQYTDFLNKVAATDTYGLYDIYMNTVNYSYGCNIRRTGSSGNYGYSVASDWANRPVNMVSFWDACRFANWLHNGQPAGPQNASTTENGAYTLNGYTGNDGRSIQRNPGAKWFVPSESEWYKAAYYKGGGTSADYWHYSTQSNTAPSNQLVDLDPGYSANYYSNGWTIGNPYWRTNVGEFENSASPYGTFDQGGNIDEWTEANDGTSASRQLRGGSFNNTFGGGEVMLRAARCGWTGPTGQLSDWGFRVAAIPEPSSLAVLLGGFVALLGMKRPRA